MKQLIVLIGLKGSGKTYIGTLMQKRLGIRFLRVEDIWLTVKTKRFTDKYYAEGFRLVEHVIDNQFKESDKITIESTGVTNYFRLFLKRLKSKYDLKLIKLIVSPDICLQRVKSRDQNFHIPVSDDILEQINTRSLKSQLEFDAIIDNERSSDDEIIEKIQQLLMQKK